MMLMSAAMGGGTAAITGGDPLKGALLGGLTGGLGAGISGALGSAGTTAATTAGNVGANATTAAANIVDDDEIEPIELSQPDEAHLAYIDEDDEVTENPGDLMSDTQQNQQLWKRANEINHHVFHHNNFRGKQGLTIASALRGEDVFVLMPTGGGKSLCYQLTALVCGGLTIVVCPLVALMREQVLQLQQMGVNSAFLSADQLDEDKKSVYRAINGYKDTVDMRLLYVTPERMSRDMHFWDSMKKLEKTRTDADYLHKRFPSTDILISSQTRKIQTR
jgi:hypothetical protein